MNIKRIIIVIIILFTIMLSGCIQNNSNVFTLDEANDIKEQVYKYYQKNTEIKIDIKNIEITDYYGEYNGAYVLSILGANDGGIPEMVKEKIESFIFEYPGTRKIEVFYKGKIYEFKEAYDQDILNIKDIEKIYKMYQEIGCCTGTYGFDYFNNGYDYIVCDTEINGLVLVDKDIKKIDIYLNMQYIPITDYINDNNIQVKEILGKYIEYFDITEYIK